MPPGLILISTDGVLYPLVCPAFLVAPLRPFRRSSGGEPWWALSDHVAPQRQPCVSPGPMAEQMQKRSGQADRNVDDLVAQCGVPRGGVAVDPSLRQRAAGCGRRQRIGSCWRRTLQGRLRQWSVDQVGEHTQLRALGRPPNLYHWTSWDALCRNVPIGLRVKCPGARLPLPCGTSMFHAPGWNRAERVVEPTRSQHTAVLWWSFRLRGVNVSRRASLFKTDARCRQRLPADHVGVAASLRTPVCSLRSEAGGLFDVAGRLDLDCGMGYP